VTDRAADPVYVVRYFHRRSRRLLPTAAEHRPMLPTPPAVDDTRLAEAHALDEPRDVWHWNGRAWLLGELPGRSLEPPAP
jgi:hypothetical protein